MADPAPDGRKARALELLCEGRPVAKVASELGAHRGTVWRWMRDAPFRAAYRAALVERVQDGALRLDAAACGALELLEDVCQDDDAPLAVRVRAAESLLRHAGEARANVVKVFEAQSRKAADIPPREVMDTALRSALASSEGRELVRGLLTEFESVPATAETIHEAWNW